MKSVYPLATAVFEGKNGKTNTSVGHEADSKTGKTDSTFFVDIWAWSFKKRPFISKKSADRFSVFTALASSVTDL